MKAAVNAGVATKFWSAGALSPWVELKGQWSLNYMLYVCNFRLVNVTDTEMTFQLARHSGNREIVFTESNYDTLVPSGQEGFCMNRAGMLRNSVDSSLSDTEKVYGSNKGGYTDSHGGRELMGQFGDSLPKEVKDVIKYAPIYYDGKGQGNTTSSAITSWTVGTFLPSQVEIFGHTNGINPYIANYTKQWQWYANGNKVTAYGTDGGSVTPAGWLLRDPDLTYPTTDFRSVTASNTASNISAARAWGMRPCFRIAK